MVLYPDFCIEEGIDFEEQLRESISKIKRKDVKIRGIQYQAILITLHLCCEKHEQHHHLTQTCQ